MRRVTVRQQVPRNDCFLPGHGGQTADLDGDEDDGYDEVIYPVDFRTAGHIVDDEMHRILVSSLQPGVRLTAIFDSCHSGSALDLPYLYSTQGVLKEPNLAKEAGQGLLGIVSSYARGDIGSMIGSATSLFKKAVNGDGVYKKNLRTKTSPADVIMWSGSKDAQTSYALFFFFFPLLLPSLFATQLTLACSPTAPMHPLAARPPGPCRGPLSPRCARTRARAMSSCSIASAPSSRASMPRSRS